VRVDGTPIHEDQLDTSATQSVEWKAADLNTADTTSPPPTLSPGQHTIRVETDVVDADGTDILIETSGTVWLDTAILYDTLVYGGTSNWANTLDGDDKLDGPPGPYSDAIWRARVDPAFRSEAGRVEADTSSTANTWQLRIGGPNDSFSSTTTTVVEHDFPDDVVDWFFNVGLDSVDATSIDTAIETEVTEHKTEPIVVDELTIDYDALKSPTVKGTVEGRREDLLNQLASRGDDIWEVQYDASADSIAVVVTRPGQRTSDADPAIVDYAAEKTVANEVSKTIIRGRTETVQGRYFVASTTGTDLGDDRLQRDSERVRDESTGEVFVRGPDPDVIAIVPER